MKNKKMEAISPQNLRQIWPLIEQGLNAIERPEGGINADIYHELMLGQCALFMLQVDDAYAGFVILREDKDYEGPRLHIWLCYSTNPEAHILSVFDEDIEIIAKNLNAKNITFGSTREGWRKIGPIHGFKPRETLYVRPVKQ